MDELPRRLPFSWSWTERFTEPPPLTLGPIALTAFCPMMLVKMNEGVDDVGVEPAGMTKNIASSSVAMLNAVPDAA